MTDILIDAQAVGRRYVQGDVSIAAVASATFRLLARDRVALVGPSGCGKSTLLHLMAALDTPTSGKIEWPALGSADSLRPEKIAMVFQAPSLLEPLTVSENVAVPLLMMDSARDIDRRVADALATFGLEGLAHKMPEELSGGQMQRVAMARAIAGTPRVILADEPTGQLDQSTGQALLDALFAHLGATDIALVIATHDPTVADRMERVWRMEHGRLTETVVAARTS
ncbi:ABC transporter ATP-binding protein [Burkholderia pseudomultivorans]|uniref:ABC transporter ATP-binding protein n=1 Tax=Burkholderia pseudomultivorans TaxID=1207504 RepID=UPI002874D096|nr:ABC transporter ATP-binding protein [Burkholderia pseudomultivorans]MDS0859807.1 ABC transporter ATP-binding protein [Burkholderia pseudomultivorans]